MPELARLTDDEETPRNPKTPDHIQGTSDDTLAVSYADQHADQIRYIGQWNRWMLWNNTHWAFDHEMRTYSYAREHVRNLAKNISDKLYRAKCDDIPPTESLDARKERMRNARAEARRAVKTMLSSRTIHAVAALARYDPRIASNVDQWDRDPWLLNTPSGTVDLKTGTMRGHRHLDYITKATAVGPENKAPELWLSFLRTIMQDDDTMIRYLQKIFGYCLVGDPKEHEMYFAYGTGRNGKGTVTNAMRGLMGNYGCEANIETFTINDSARHPTELADLRGARLVTCGEVDEGQRWAEARIKQLTGGDPIKARFMRQDFFEYQPQFKLFISGNHKPKLSNVDPAIEARFRLIPFTHHVLPQDRDKNLGTKLQAEWPRILNWAIEGCLLWQSEGLTPPTVVAEATSSYLSQEDAISAWLNECCDRSEDSFEYIADLFKSWETWARDNGEAVGSKRQFSRLLEDREPLLRIRRGRRESGLGFHGIELLTPPKDK